MTGEVGEELLHPDGASRHPAPAPAGAPWYPRPAVLAHQVARTALVDTQSWAHGVQTDRAHWKHSIAFRVRNLVILLFFLLNLVLTHILPSLLLIQFLLLCLFFLFVIPSSFFLFSFSSTSFFASARY